MGKNRSMTRGVGEERTKMKSLPKKKPRKEEKNLMFKREKNQY